MPVFKKPVTGNGNKKSPLVLTSRLLDFDVLGMVIFLGIYISWLLAQ